mgnify:CR=1 FL=1
MNHICSPLPEAIDGKKWDVSDGAGTCDTVSRVMRVPLGPSDADRFVRNHEMAHGKITPRVSPAKQCKKYDVSIDAVQVCEDLRMHLFLEAVGVARPGAFTQAEMDAMVARKATSDRMLALTLVACLNTGDWDKAVQSMITQVEKDRLDRIFSNVRAIEKTLRQGRNLHRPIGFRNGSVPAARLFDAIFPSMGPCREDLPMSTIVRQSAVRRRGVAEWGEMAIQTLHASLSRRVPSISRTRTFRDEGTALGAVHRLPVDGRIFTRLRVVKGGTVLIDGSGSMRLQSSELLRIVETAPAATIAIYSGRGKRGTLTVIGRKGLVATEEGLAIARKSGGGNIVDGPALAWLAKQHAPRVWVSDGLVTGKHDSMGINLAVECQNLCRRHTIKRVEKNQAVVDFLKASRQR